KTVVTEAGWEEFNRMGALKEVYEGALAVFYGVIDVEVNNADYSQRGPRVTAAIAPMSDAAGPITGWLDNMQAQKEVAASEANDAANRVAQVSTVIEVILVVIVILLSLFIAFYISGGIEKTLNEIINKLSASSGTINASAIQLSEASDNLASGSSRQAAAIEETSATMNETSSMVEQNAENTRVAAQLALDATNMANKGMTEMKDMSRAMEEMKDSSDKVGRIIKTIDDIAFQTNLLAINATVEAARAGEAGRSFGVVAQAVRDLAQQSADAAANTAEIIDGNISLTNSGREISREVSLSLEQITDKTSQLNKLIAEINAASEEQASGIKQINVAVTQMETVTQENAAVAEETSAASHSMQDEIGNLEDAVRIAERLVKIR
ncbi:MAG: methyl-accepting chemotaxis protein, partial [Oscillospiraceae bacterium]|nr:methyl-accepting chemotaxis protein [Oscillospiraceae bacterium]